MSSPSMIIVTILSAATVLEPPLSRIEYEVRNNGNSPVWLVSDDWLVWHQQGYEIELSFSRAKMQSGAQVFGYFAPKVIPLQPGEFATKVLELRWPLRLDRLWNVDSLVAPPAGKYSISVRIGYGVTAAPEPSTLELGAEASVLKWQCTAVSEPVTIEIPSTLSGGDLHRRGQSV